MKFAIIIGLAALSVASCNLLDINPGPKGLTGGAVSTNTTVDLAIGGQLYRAQCARCHGDSGQGSSVAPRSIQGMAGIWNVVHVGSGLMPAFPSLSDADVKSIELYLGQFHPSGLDTMSGQTIYVQYCQTCHGETAQGLYGKGVAIQGDSANVDSFVVNGGATMPKFPLLTTAQRAKIKSFLMTFTIPTDGAGLYSRYCATCHGADALGDSVTYCGIAGGHTDIWTPIHNGFKSRYKAFPNMESIPEVTHVQADSILQWLKSTPYPHTGRILWNVDCFYCHGPKGSVFHNANKTNFSKDVVDGITGEGMPASPWYSQPDLDSLYFYVTH